MTGTLITLEGIDGGGKTTVYERLQDERPDALFLHEPLHPGLEQAIRSNDLTPLGDLLAFLADRSTHVEETIQPALRDERTVIMDRYADSTRAYQAVTLRERVPDAKEYIETVMTPTMVEPDLTLLFDLSPEIAIKRSGGTDKFEQNDLLADVRSNYLRLAAGTDRFRIIDAEQPPEAVYDGARATIDTHLQENL